MRVFLTGASGYLGAAILARLARAGHAVTGVVRDASHARLGGSGAHLVQADLSQPESYLAEMKNSDAVVHAAFDEAQTATTDQQVLEAVRVAAQDGRVRRLLYTSGVWVHGATAGTIVDERSPLAPARHVSWRPAHEAFAQDLAEVEVDAVILRPGIVYGGAGGIVGDWFREARDLGAVTYPGDGSQHWCLVHLDDMAEAYGLALEHGKGGERFLLTDESRFTARELAEAAAAVSGVSAQSRPRQAVIEERGTYGEALLLDQRATSAKARRDLGWVPLHTHAVREMPDLLAEWQAGQQTPVR